MVKAALKVLVPLDGSPESESILPVLLPLVRGRDAEVTLLGVADDAWDSACAWTLFSRIRRSMLLDGVRAASRVMWGRPAESILHTAAARGFDLIAMATHGRSGLRRALFGSVTEQVVRRAPVPVIAARPDARVGDWTRIVVALDGSRHSEEVLPEARLVSGLGGGTLHLVQVVPLLLSHADLAGFGPAPVLLNATEASLEEPVARLEAEGVPVVKAVREGGAAEEIVRYARETGAGLICMTTHGRRGVGRWVLGSVAEEVLRRAPCPVLIKRAAAAEAKATA